MKNRFVVLVHKDERIVEVHYPARPTEANYSAYETEIRAAIEKIGGVWDCLVDQTALKALAPEFPPRIADLNTWARGKGMRKTARVVSESAIGELQGARILRDSGLRDVGAIFKSREDAWAFLRGK